MISPADNPVWHALSSFQSHLNCGNGRLKYFAADVSPFVGMEHWDESEMMMLTGGLPAGRNFAVMMKKEVVLPEALNILFSFPLFRMECNELPDAPPANSVIQKLGSEDIPQMLELTAKTKPGPFFARTIDMGSYYGIFENGRLAAMAGERLCLPGYTELSAICTDPGFLGRGYGKLLTGHVAQQVFKRGHKPMLHVKTDNDRAIDVYRRSGFEVSAEIFFAIFRVT